MESTNRVRMSAPYRNRLAILQRPPHGISVFESLGVIAQIAQPRLTSADTPLSPFEHMVDTGWLGRCSRGISRRTSRNGRWAESPSLCASSDPTAKWWPATANRCTDVPVHWVEDGQAQDHRYEVAWLRAEDVRQFLKT
jgi:hypothetical protein